MREDWFVRVLEESRNSVESWPTWKRSEEIDAALKEQTVQSEPQKLDKSDCR